MTAVETHDAISALAREWDELADRTDTAPFLRPGWVEAWSSAFRVQPLRIVAARREGRLVALVPLVRRRDTLESATNWHTPGFGILAEDQVALHELTSGLFVGGPRCVSLSFLNHAGPELETLRAGASDRRYRIRVRTLGRTPYVDIHGDWAAYEARLPSKRRGDLRRRQRLLEREGAISFAVETGSHDLDTHLAEGFRIEGSGWKDEAGTAIASQPETRQFYTEVARWAADRGWLRLAFLRLNGKAIAFEYALQHKGVYYFLKGGYDTMYSRFSPGRLLIRAILEHSFATGLQRYDFGGVDELFKLEWATGYRELVELRAFAPSIGGVASWAVSPIFAYGPPAVRRARALLQR